MTGVKQRLQVVLVLSLVGSAVFAAQPTVGPRVIDGTNVPESQFPTVGRVGDGLSGDPVYYGSGTLISPRHVLTAGHVVSDSSGMLAIPPTFGRFKLGGVVYKTSNIIVHPTYRGDASFLTEGDFDLAILELDTPVPGVTPSPVYRPVPIVGTQLIIAGFGLVGEGRTGVNGNSVPPPEGTIEWGFAPLEVVTPTFLKWIFSDVPPPNNEVNTSPGDSGGPAFIDVAGQFQVAAVTTGGSNFDASFGDNSFDTRAGPVAAWIDAVTGGLAYNDAFADAAPIYGTVVRTTGLNSGASKEAGEPNHAGNAGGASVWWRWTAPSSGTVTISTAGSGFDTLLAVYTGTTVATLAAVGSNNDAGASDATSLLTFQAVGGKTYHIAVDGVGAATGKIKLSLALQGTADLIISSIELMEDLPFPGEDVTFIVTVYNQGATEAACMVGFWPNLDAAPTLDTPPPFADFTDVPAGGKDILYFTVPAPNVKQALAWAYVDDYLGISEVAESDETNNTGSCKWVIANDLVNDNFQNAIELPEGDAYTLGTNAGATKEDGEPNHAGKAGGASVWWKWTAVASGWTTISTQDSSFDTLLGIYTGSTVSALTTIAANDDRFGDFTSTVDFQAVAGTTYYIAVDGVNQGYGRIALSITSASTNDLNVKKLQIRFNFKSARKDSLRLNGSLDLVSPLVDEKTPALVLVGDLSHPLTLDLKGKSTDKTFKLMNSIRGAQFSFSLKNEALLEPLSSLGFTKADVTAALITVPVVVVIGADSYVGLTTVIYKAKAATSGQAK